MIPPLKLRWQRLLPRERRLLLAAAAALLILTMQHGVLKPLHSWQQQQQQNLQRAANDLRWMQQQQPRLERLNKQQPAPLPAPLADALIRSAAEKSVTLAAVGEQLTLVAQPLPPLLRWLAELEQGYAVQPARLTLRAESGGDISGTLSFDHDK